MKRFNVVVAPFYLLMVPVAYLLLNLGQPAYSIFVVLCCFEFVAFFVKTTIVMKIFPQLTNEVYGLYFKCCVSLFVAGAIGYCMIISFGETVVSFIIKLLISLIFSSSWVYFIVLNSREKKEKA